MALHQAPIEGPRLTESGYGLAGRALRILPLAALGRPGPGTLGRCGVALPPELQDTYRAWWQLVQHAASAKAEDGGYLYTVADVQSAASAILAESGQPRPFSLGPQLSSLFGMARSADRAIGELEAAGGNDTITSGMVATWPTAAPEFISDVAPEFMAKASFTYTNALGEQSTGWITMTGITQIPPTPNNLRLRLQGAAQQSYAVGPEEGGTPNPDAEVMAEFGEFTSVQLFAV